MDLRLHPGSVAPAEGHEKCGPRRPTNSGSSCNNATLDDRDVEVITRLGNADVKKTFKLADMVFGDKLAL